MPPTPGRRRRPTRLLDVVALVPSGPLAMSPDFDGLVETSTSLGEAATDGERLTLHSLTRSSNDSALPEVDRGARRGRAARRRHPRGEAQLQGLAARPRLEGAGGRANRSTSGSSASRRSVTAIHAGLETAVIGTKVSGPLDMLAIGPQIEGPHSPDERVSIPTVERFWCCSPASSTSCRPGSARRRRCAEHSPGSSRSSPVSWS